MYSLVQKLLSEHTHTDTHKHAQTGPTALLGPLKRSAKVWRIVSLFSQTTLRVCYFFGHPSRPTEHVQPTASLRSVIRMRQRTPLRVGAANVVSHTSLCKLLNPNSITLSGSKLVRSWFEPDSVMEFGFEPVCDQLRTRFEPASVMEFGFYQKNNASIKLST